MGGLEAALTGLRDEIPQIRKYKYHREILTFCVCGSAFLFALQNITNVIVFVYVYLTIIAIFHRKFHLWSNHRLAFKIQERC
jgi:hypothetical protein